MASIPSTGTMPSPRTHRVTDLTSRSAYQAYSLLYIGYFALPLVAGVDKFFHFLVDWDMYLAPLATRIFPVPAHTFMLVIGIIEIVAATIVAASPRLGGYLVAIWLWAIVLNLLLIPGFYDVALRDFGLSLGAMALAQLSDEVGRIPQRRF